MTPTLPTVTDSIQAGMDEADDPQKIIEKERGDKNEKNEPTKAQKATAPVPAILLTLCDRFPNLFDLKNRKPLTVTIEEDILQELGAEGVARNDIHQALMYYMKGDQYQKGLDAQEHRFDLKGEVSGLVTDHYAFEKACQKKRNFFKKRFFVPPLIQKLCELFPNTFSINERKPLKIGISKEILGLMKEGGWGSGLALRKALNWYVNRQAYHKAILDHAHRFDLEGNPVEEITPDQKGHAQDMLDKIKVIRTTRSADKQPLQVQDTSPVLAE